MSEQQLAQQMYLLTTDDDIAALQYAVSEIPLFALDIETAYWWDKRAERVSLIQIGIPQETGIDVWIIDCFAALDLQPIQEIMINPNIRKVIHNAGFDVAKLRRLANVIVENVYDTMLAARRSGERGCSLASLAARHLGITLDKKLQRSDWARRPLDYAQLEYAAADVAATLMLYQRQLEMGFDGEYLRRSRHNYHEERPQVTFFEQPVRLLSQPIAPNEAAAEALIRIVTQFPGRYTPQSLANCLGRERGGLPGWIVDEAISKEAFIDYQEALMIVSALMAMGRLIDRGRRLSVARPLLLE